MYRTYSYRLYPNKKQVESLEEMLEVHRQLYNAALEERREAWRRKKVSISYFTQSNELSEIRNQDDELSQYDLVSLRQTLRQLDKAFSAFFRRVKKHEKAGYPRFKGYGRFDSITFQFGNGIRFSGDRLVARGAGELKTKWHRPIPEDAEIKQVVIKRKNNKWYAHFMLELPEPAPKPHAGEQIGIDLGLISFAALSNGESIDAPRYLRQSEKKLRVQQRRLSRRKKSSGRRKQARKLVAKTHEHIASQRKDFNHKLSTRLTKEFSLIALEDLNVKGLAKSMLAKSVNDAAWSQFVNQLKYKVENTGTQLIFVDPRYTSQVCSDCGCIVHKDLSVRIHDCPDCGLVIDRDVNAARNILKSALGRSVSPPTYATGQCVGLETANAKSSPLVIMLPSRILSLPFSIIWSSHPSMATYISTEGYAT